jgi:hypothetical protein
MLPLSQIVGKQEDWAQVVTNVAMVDTPFLGWLPVGKAPVAVERLYQADSYDPPAENSHPDGMTVIGAKSAGRNRVQLRSLIQYMTKMADVTKLTQELGNVAGVADELGDAITKETKELSKDIEAWMLSPQECRIGVTGITGYKSRGVPNWIQTGAQAVYPVDSSVRPPAASVDATATGSLTEDVVLNILQSIGQTTRSSRQMTAFVGPNGQRCFDNFPIFLPSTVATVNGGAYPSPIRGGAIDRMIKRYASPFGPLDLMLSYNNYALPAVAGVPNAATLVTHSFFILHQDMWEVAWHTKPQWYRKAYEGGLYEAFCEAILMLTCWNPKGEGKYAPLT